MLALALQNLALVWAFEKLCHPVPGYIKMVLSGLAPPALLAVLALLGLFLFTLVFIFLLQVLSMVLSPWRWRLRWQLRRRHDDSGRQFTAVFVSLLLSSLIVTRGIGPFVIDLTPGTSRSWMDSVFLFCANALALLGSTRILFFVYTLVASLVGGRHIDAILGGWISSGPVLLTEIILLAVLWYDFRYDPAGTYRPSWTNKLG